MTQFVMSSVTVFKAAIWVKISRDDKILIDNLKEDKNGEYRTLYVNCRRKDDVWVDFIACWGEHLPEQALTLSTFILLKPQIRGSRTVIDITN